MRAMRQAWWWTLALAYGFGGCGSGGESAHGAEGGAVHGGGAVSGGASSGPSSGGTSAGSAGGPTSGGQSATTDAGGSGLGAGGAFNVGGSGGDGAEGNEPQTGGLAGGANGGQAGGPLTGGGGSSAAGASGSAGEAGSSEAGAGSTVPATCAERASCRFVAAAACLGEAPVPCQCDAQCQVQTDCCADATTACADARQDDVDLLAALQARDATRIAEIVARGRYDPTRALSSVLRDREGMTLLVNAGVPLNLRDRIGYTPLMREEADLAMTGLLLDAGADLEARSAACLTPLMVRIQNSGDIQIPNLLIDRGANVNAVTPNGNTPLLFAITAFWVGPVYKLLQAGADPSARNTDGATPLTESVRHSLPGAVRSLISFGADLNSTGPSGEPFWVYALVDNSPTTTRLTRDDDELVEWVFSHPELLVDLAAPGAAAAITTALSRPHIAHYASYLQARGQQSPSLSEGTLIDTFEGSEYRIANGHLRKNGLDVTPPSFDLSVRPLFVVDHWYVFPLDTASLAPGFSNVSGADYTKRFFYYGPRYSSWSYALDALNLRGLASYEIVPELYGASVTTQLPGANPIRRDEGMTVYTRPYRP